MEYREENMRTDVNFIEVCILFGSLCSPIVDLLPTAQHFYHVLKGFKSARYSENNRTKPNDPTGKAILDGGVFISSI
jgi:hypothetical protein